MNLFYLKHSTYTIVPFAIFYAIFSGILIQSLTMLSVLRKARLKDKEMRILML